MKLQGLTIKTIVSEDGMLLTQAGEVPAEERTFSSKVYDDNLDNWVEWTQDDVNNFLEEYSRNESSEFIE